MKIYDNGTYRELTVEEVAQMKAEAERAEAEYWRTVNYHTAVETEVWKEYTIGQELSIQRQKEEKPDEWAEYYTYCEKCKAYVKAMKAKYAQGGNEL